ncbi:replication-associated recombination protein A, partial [Propionibacterium freudenreichii]|nr:replication-associated recombination protein A [Propionibacterium freudenreichii]
APKSNAVYLALTAAMNDVRAGKGTGVPAHLRDAHYATAQDYGHGVGYRYAHDWPHGVAPQQYLPDDLEGTSYYQPTDHGNEAAIGERLATIREILHEQDEPGSGAASRGPTG